MHNELFICTEFSTSIFYSNWFNSLLKQWKIHCIFAIQGIYCTISAGGGGGKVLITMTCRLWCFTLILLRWVKHIWHGKYVKIFVWQTIWTLHSRGGWWDPSDFFWCPYSLFFFLFFTLFFKINLVNFWHPCHIPPPPQILVIGAFVILGLPDDFSQDPPLQAKG